MRSLERLTSLFLAYSLVGTAASFAGAGQLQVEKNEFFTQTSSSQPAASSNSGFSAQVFPNNLPPPTPGFDLTGATVTPPGGSPIAIYPFSMPQFFSNQ